MARLGAQPALLKLLQHRHDPLARICLPTALPTPLFTALTSALAAFAVALVLLPAVFFHSAGC